MNESAIGITLEVGLAVLLSVVLYFCWRLERKLSALRSGSDGVRAAALELKEAAARAEAAVRGMRIAANDSGRDLQARIDDARAMADRLGIGAGRMRSSADARAGRAW